MNWLQYIILVNLFQSVELLQSLMVLLQLILANAVNLHQELKRIFRFVMNFILDTRRVGVLFLDICEIYICTNITSLCQTAFEIATLVILGDILFLKTLDNPPVWWNILSELFISDLGPIVFVSAVDDSDHVQKE